MQRFVLRRLAQSVVLLFVLALIIFALARVSGNPADLLLREDATQEDRAHFLHALGLDRPVHEQLYLFLGGLLRGDLGESIRYRKPAAEVFFERLPNGILNGLGVNFYFGGTSLLIVVGVAMDTVNQIESQLIMRHYDGFTPKSGRIRGRRTW